MQLFIPPAYRYNLFWLSLWLKHRSLHIMPKYILLQFQCVTTCFIHHIKLTNLSLQIPFKTSFLQTSISVFHDCKATSVDSGVFFGGWREVVRREVPWTTLYLNTVRQQKKDVITYSGIKYRHVFKKYPPTTIPNLLLKLQAFKFKALMMKKLMWPTYQTWQLVGSDRMQELVPSYTSGNFLKLWLFLIYHLLMSDATQVV